ncbi:MAG: virulence RhuM family protein [Lachnospiraceae bacterium]|nr:virulence RhuM family protein [Lachnospiraceae bacterium]
MDKTNEIVLFETEDKEIKLNVPIEQETVWLTQAQMTELFATSKQNVSLHINNCFREGELDKNSVVKDFFTTASDGKKYKTKYYNLDVIISVGYRVKSKRGVEFRRWANSVLKAYNFKLRLTSMQTIAIRERKVAVPISIRISSF